MAISPVNVPKIFGDVPAFMGIDYDPNLKNIKADAIIIGMPYDGISTFRGGATRRAPQEIRKYSLLFSSYNFDWDMHALDYIKVLDCGDVDVLPGNTIESYKRLENRISEIQNCNAVPIMMGGDHGVTFPGVKAVVRKTGGPTGFLLFDTHLDLSEDFNNDLLTRASPVKRILELDEIDKNRVAIIGCKGPRNLPEWTPLYKKLGLKVYSDREVQVRGVENVTREALKIVSPDGKSPYISVDIDAIDPAFAPGTNSIEPGGLTSREIINGVRIACEKGFCGFDLVEVSPDFDVKSGITSTLAAKIIVEAICSLAALRCEKVEAWDLKY